MKDTDQDSAQVKFPPPLALLLFITIGGILQWFYPVSLIPSNLPPTVRYLTGGGVFIACLAIVLSIRSGFERIGTNIKPWKTTHKIQTDGFYAYSRNPIYTAFILAGLAVAYAFDSLWIALMLIPFAILIQKYVINKEEAYLEKKFGEEYRTYKSNVRRWI